MGFWVFESFPLLQKPLGRGQSTALWSNAHLRELMWCTGGDGGALLQRETTSGKCQLKGLNRGHWFDGGLAGEGRIPILDTGV